MSTVQHRRIGRVLGAAAIGIAALCFAGTAADAQRSAPMTRQEISVAGHPNALCNDGTLPILYFQAGSGDDRNKWVIYLQGGGGCASDQACADRAKTTHDLVSSNDVNLPSALVADGILSTVPAVNPDFAGYTHVFLHYCSSDTYAGDGDRVIAGATWHFRGAEIVTAMLDQLAAPSDPALPSLKDATEVLVTGGSAGAMGVHNNLDRIAVRLAPAKVKGIADSGWIPSIPPFGPGMFDVRPDSAAAMAFYNAQPDDSCVAANRQDAGACLAEPFAFSYVTTPLFIYADQEDPQLLDVLGLSKRPQTVPESQYVYDYAKALRDGLAANVPAYFVADLNRHTVLLTRSFATVKAGDQTLGATLHAWYFGTNDAPLTVVGPAPGTAGTVK
jgi:O-palmitoleoyl-L-serine hydrolase